MYAYIFITTIFFSSAQETNEQKERYEQIIENFFSVNVYDPFFQKKQIYFNCTTCEAPTFRVEVVVNNLYKASSVRILDKPSVLCPKISYSVYVQMMNTFKTHFLKMNYTGKNQKLIFYLRPERLLKC